VWGGVNCGSQASNSQRGSIIMLNNHLFQKFKLIGIDEFNYLINILMAELFIQDPHISPSIRVSIAQGKIFNECHH
jgi:hypothetical protein